MKYFIFISFTILFSLTLRSQQKLDILTISGRYGFPQQYDSIYKGKATETGGMLNLVVPVQFSKKTIWYNSLNYFYSNVSNNETTPEYIANPINLHGFILRTGLYQKFSEGRGFQLLFAPRFMTDFHHINSNHFQFGLIALYEKIYSDKLKIAFGAMFNQELFGPYLVPMINLDWKISDRWSITGSLPIFTKIKYKVNDKFTMGYSHFGLLTTYRLGNAYYQGDYIQRQSIDETLFGRYHIAGNFYLEGRFGRALGRKYAQYDADQKVGFSLPLIGFNDNRIQKNVSFQDGWIASLRIIYSIEIP